MIPDAAVRSGLDEVLARLVRSGPVRGDAALDASALAERAGAHGIEALVAHRLRERRDAPPALARLFADLATAAAVTSALKDRELQRVLATLKRDGIDVLIVKGAALAHTDYPQPHLRPRVDTDVLVRRRDLDGLTGSLGAIGYRPSASLSTGELVSHQRAFEHQDARGMRHVLDVHWRLANPQVFAAGLDESALFRRAVPVPALGPAARTLPLADHLLLCAIHRLAHHQHHERLIWLFDIHLLARRASADEWDEIVALAGARRMRGVCLSGLLRTREAFGTPLPETALLRLGEPADAEPSAAWVRHHQRPLDVLQSDLRVLPSWRDRVQLLREHAFPQPAFVLDRYGMTSRAWLPALYAHRLMTGLWKWLIAR